MTIQTQAHQDVKYHYIESVMEDLKQHGYGVILNPSSKDLPFDLGHYHPDLVAFKDGGGLVMEAINPINYLNTCIPVVRYRWMSLISSNLFTLLEIRLLMVSQHQ